MTSATIATALWWMPEPELELEEEAHKIWRESVLAELELAEKQRDAARAELKGWRDCVELYERGLEHLEE